MEDGIERADELNDLWDDVVRGGRREYGDPGLIALLNADAQTPEPETVFVRSLRASLIPIPVRHERKRRSGQALGIVAHPDALKLSVDTWRYRMLLFTAAALIAIAILGSGLTFHSSGRPEVGVPTAQASAINFPPTPTVDATVTSATMDGS